MTCSAFNLTNFNDVTINPKRVPNRIEKKDNCSVKYTAGKNSGRIELLFQKNFVPLLKMLPKVNASYFLFF